MKRLLTAALCAAPMALASCATMPTASSATIDRVQARYNDAKAWADPVLPYVSAERASRIRLAMALTERALLAARVAATISEQQAALKQADAATSVITTAH